MAGPLAEATADLRLSDGRFNTDLATIQSRLRTAVSQMESQAKVDLAATIKVDDSAARATVAAFREEASAVDQISAQIDVHTAGLQAARDELVNLALLADSLTDKRVTIDPVVRDQEAIATATRLQTILTELGSESVIFTVGGNATEAFAAIAELSLELDKLDTRRVDVKLSADGVAKTTAEVAALDAAAGATASDNGGFGRMALRLGFFGVAGVAAIGALGGKIVQLGVSSAAALEGTVASFTNILGSADKAKSLFTELQAFSIPSPFDTQVLATTARQLLAIQVPLEQVIPDVKILSAVVAELGNSDPQAFGQLTRALGQIGSSSKALIPDIRQISTAIPGFNAEVELATGVAAKYGVTVQEAGKKIQDGTVTGSEAMQILLDRMKEFPGASGAIAAAADTLQGRLSSFKDTIKQDLVGAFSGVSSQVKEALGPLSESVDVALKAIGPQLADSLSGLIPAIGPFVEELGTALAPAFGGIATGLGGVLQGIGPGLSAILPVVGHLAEVFGDLAAAIGPSLGTAITVLSDTVIPVIDSLSSVLEAIPTGVLSTLLTGFLAFKALSGIRSIFDGLALSIEKSNAAVAGASTSKLKEMTEATGKFSQVAGRATSVVVGAFSGIALSSEDMSTRVLGAVGAVSSVVTQLAAGNEVGAAFTAGATVVGGLIGNFVEGERKAKAFQAAVESLAKSIKTELDLQPGEVPDLGEIVLSKAFDAEFQDKLSTKLRGTLARSFNLTDEDTKAVLQGTKEQFDAFIGQFFETKDGDSIIAPKLKLSEHDRAELFNALTDLRVKADAEQKAIKDSQDASASSADNYGKALERLNALWDNTGPVSAFTAAIDKSTSSLSVTDMRYRDAATQFGSFIDTMKTGANDLANAGIDTALERIKKVAEDVKDTFSDLSGALSQSIANQNLQAQLNGLSDSLNEVIGKDKFEAAKQRAESINDQIRDQQDRIADLKASLAEAQAKALQDAADLDVRIADARKFGSVTGLAALEAARANVGNDADKAQRDLEKAQRTIGDLQDQLAGLDLSTPQKLIDIVKGQARTAGVDLWTFLLQGPTEEARQLYQQDLAAVVNSAFTQIQGVDDKQGPQAALDLVGSIQGSLRDQLLKGGFAPGTVDEIVKSMLNPDELTKTLTDELNANLAAATIVGPTVNVGLSTADVEKALTDLQEAINKGGPVTVSFTFAPSSPTLTPDFADLDKQLFLHPSIDFDEADRLLANHQAALGSQVAPDFADADKQLRTHGSPLLAVVDPDFDEADRILANHTATTRAVVRPDTTLLDQVLGLQRTIVVQLTADPNQILQINTQPGQFVAQAQGSVLFDRPLSHLMRDSAHVAQIAPAGAWRVWAEPETGGEGYVPLALGKRGRSTEIVRTIADMFGYRLEPKIEPHIDVFPAVSPVVNLHPSFTVPPSALPVGAGRDTSIVQTFAQSLASFGQPTVPDGRMFLTLPHLVGLAVKANLDSGLTNPSFRPEAFIGSFVQSLATPPSSRPALSSVAQMTGWTTADPKAVLWPVSPWSVPSVLPHDIPAFPSPVVSQLVVWRADPQGALVPPWAPGGLAQLFDTKTLVGPGFFQSAVWPNLLPPSITFNPTAQGVPSLHLAPPNVSTVATMFAVDQPTPNLALSPTVAVKVTTSPDSELAAAVRELTAMLRSGSPHSERLARAEAVARHFHIEAGAITMVTEKPRQSARELVDEFTRMAY